MGCSASRSQFKKAHTLNLDDLIQQQIRDSVHQNQLATLDCHEQRDDISLYDKNLEKKVKVPKLRQPIFNSLVQRRKMQQLDEKI